MARIRTFVAIDTTNQIRTAGERLIRSLAKHADHARWTRPKDLHLTLKFLGDVDERSLPEVCDQLSQALVGISSFQVDCASVGVFPDVQRPTTIWMGVRDAEGQLGKLRAQVERSMRDLGFPGEQRPFRGHITLGRLRRQATEVEFIQQFLEQHAESEFGSVPVQQCTLYRSELQRSGPEYTAVGRFKLA